VEEEEEEDAFDVLARIFGRPAVVSSPDFLYATRYFAVIFDPQGEVRSVTIHHIPSVGRDLAMRHALTLRKRLLRFGAYRNYYYRVHVREDGSSIVVALDCSSQIAIGQRLVFSAMVLILIGIGITFLVVRSFSRVIVRQEIQNAEIQKQFLTNASHELKTPLAVIRANTEIMEVMSGESEWSRSTMRQLDRLDSLIRNLVLITRAQEGERREERTDIDVSALVRETVASFDAVARQDRLTVVQDIPEGIRFQCTESQIRQLCTLLIDNAIKYCDPEGEIRVVLQKRGKGLRLSVSNSFCEGEDIDCNCFFNRFYRADTSHNTDREGYGIGLSIAEHIVGQYRGSISASWQGGIITFHCALNS
jgi:signal transduction histidine kinase